MADILIVDSQAKFRQQLIRLLEQAHLTKPALERSISTTSVARMSGTSAWRMSVASETVATAAAR
jgi:hypothetical protein